MGKVNHKNYITIVKAIGIILMVIGHSGCPQPLYRLVYLFHMPLFFICSGIFYRDITFDDFFSFVKKKIIDLYVPFVIWSISFLFLHNWLMLVGIYNPYYGFENGSSYYSIYEIFPKLLMIIFTMHGYEELLGGFWFIRSLFISSLLIAIVSVLMKMNINYKHEVSCLLFLIITIIIRRYAPDIEFWRDISMGTFGAFFYMFGYLMMRYIRCWQNNYCFFLCVSSLFLSFFYFKEGLSMRCGFNKVLPYSISATLGTILIIYISKAIEKNLYMVKIVLYYIGNHTLDILALHFLSFRIVNGLVVLFYGIDAIHIAEHPIINTMTFSSYLWVVYSIVGLCVPLIIKRIWQVCICNYLSKNGSSY